MIHIHECHTLCFVTARLFSLLLLLLSMRRNIERNCMILSCLLSFSARYFTWFGCIIGLKTFEFMIKKKLKMTLNCVRRARVAAAVAVCDFVTGSFCSRCG